MKRLSKNLFIVLVSIFCGCDDVLEEDISDGIISIIAPADGQAIEGNVVQLRWGEIDGADDYRVQIMVNRQFIMLDSLVADNIFNYQINPGEYTWRVRAENFAYTSAFSFESAFSVVASIDLTDQLITLESPDNNTYINEGNLNFSWQPINTADTYEFEILEVAGSSETSIFKDEDLVSASITVPTGTVTKDAEYIWQVKASNASSATKFYQRKFFLDTQAPPAPALNTPTSDQVFTTTTPVDFTWTYTDTGSIQSNITSTLEVSTDENFSTINLSETNANGEFSNTFSTANTYYWRVKGVDAAGNSGVNSATGSFVVN